MVTRRRLACYALAAALWALFLLVLWQVRGDGVGAAMLLMLTPGVVFVGGAALDEFGPRRAA